MIVVSFDAFFHAATGNTPYDYQRRLTCGERGRTAGELKPNHFTEREGGAWELTEAGRKASKWRPANVC